MAVVVQYVPEMTGADVAPPVTITTFDGLDKHLVPENAIAFTESQPCSESELIVQEPPAVVVPVATCTLFTYNKMIAPETLSGDGSEPPTDVEAEVSVVVVMIGVDVVPDVPLQNQTGVDSHLPGDVAVMRNAPLGMHDGPPEVQELL